MKTEQLQIRVTPEQKAELKRRAKAAGQDVSGYVLARALTPESGEFTALAASLHDPRRRDSAIAELIDLLTALPARAFPDAVSAAPPPSLSPFLRNYLAALVEQAAARAGVPPPAWVMDVPALPEPWFGTSLKSLRPYLLTASPVPFRRRNIFIDAALGSRV